MWKFPLFRNILLFHSLLHLGVSSQEALVVDDGSNSTNDDYFLSTKGSLPLWTNRQLIICFVSVSLGTLLFFVTFIVPVMIILRRLKRDKNQFDLRELRRMSDFM